MSRYATQAAELLLSTGRTQIRAQAYMPKAEPMVSYSYSCPMLYGLPMPRWTRYGMYGDDGQLTVTAVM